MPTTLLIIAHPDSSSFNYRLFHQIRSQLQERGQACICLDLYQTEFSPVLTRSELFQKYPLNENDQSLIRDFEAADTLCLVYPEWWGMVPAVLKGWLDKVLRPGVAYETDEEGQTRGLCQNKRLLVFSTYQEERYGSKPPLRSIWEEDIGKFCAFHTVHFHRYRLPSGGGQKEKSRILEEVNRDVNRIFPLM